MNLLLHVSMCEICGVNQLSAQKRPLKIHYYGVGLLENRTYVGSILASIRSSWNHITCATNQENNTYSAFVLPNFEIQKIFTLVVRTDDL